jgi:methylenetetrahydrofolate dehydrogenase (NADP+)/methenyltetrahydrofolate cyclohydrolase
MSAQVLRGAPVAAALDERTAAEAAVLQDRGVAPTLALLRVGEDPSDLAYERSVVKRAQQVGVAVRGVALAAEASQASLMAAVQDINQDPAVHGCLFFRPLPAGLDEPALCDALAAPKDVDGGGLSALGALFTGRGGGFAPCTAQACLELLDYYGIDLKGKRVVVVGRSLVVGKPVAMLALARHATVTICHSRTQGLAALCRQADVLVA